MGFPLSLIIAKIVLQNLEKKDLRLLSIGILFYHRYIDDIALTTPRYKIDEFLNTFNLLYPRL